MSEANLWNEIRPMLKGQKIHASRVESHSTVPGFPDVDLCVEGVEFKMELKFSDDKNAPHVRGSQVRWISKRTRTGGRVIIMAKIATDSGFVYSFHHGRYVKALYESTSVKEWYNVPGVFVPTLDKEMLMNCLMETLHHYD